MLLSQIIYTVPIQIRITKKETEKKQHNRVKREINRLVVMAHEVQFHGTYIFDSCLFSWIFGWHKKTVSSKWIKHDFMLFFSPLFQFDEFPWDFQSIIKYIDTLKFSSKKLLWFHLVKLYFVYQLSLQLIFFVCFQKSERAKKRNLLVLLIIRWLYRRRCCRCCRRHALSSACLEHELFIRIFEFNFSFHFSFSQLKNQNECAAAAGRYCFVCYLF